MGQTYSPAAYAQAVWEAAQSKGMAQRIEGLVLQSQWGEALVLMAGANMALAVSTTPQHDTAVLDLLEAHMRKRMEEEKPVVDELFKANFWHPTLHQVGALLNADPTAPVNRVWALLEGWAFDVGSKEPRLHGLIVLNQFLEAAQPLPKKVMEPN